MNPEKLDNKLDVNYVNIVYIHTQLALSLSVVN